MSERADLVRVGDGETITARERRHVELLAAGGGLTVTWSRYAPGEPGPDLHVHREHTDAFYVLEGELTIRVGPAAERVTLAAGGFVAVPPGVVHTYDSELEARWLNFHAPDCGFADYLRALRDGGPSRFDQFDPPADGGAPGATAIVAQRGEGERRDGALVRGAPPGLTVAELDLEAAAAAGASAWFVLAGRAAVDGVRADPGTLAVGARSVAAAAGASARVLAVWAGADAAAAPGA
jgi:quercetin dioxygenase-like cupin family protein